ncbi:MAG TPA: DUF6152 family protein [Bryobacteraceae bacterium]|jgi:hypothetical protein|nr:DUF6152 family protein [Bryobacteraceae bacterium]
MKNMRWTLLAFAASLLLMPGMASGHHGWAAFESKTTVTFKGTVTDFHFVNPHSVVDFDVKDDQSQVQSWQGELTSAARLASKGWTATSVEAGDEVTITGYRAQSGVRTLRISKIVANGTELKIEAGN